MTAVASKAGSLSIVGQVAMGFPPPANTYRAVAYNNTQPAAPTATWLRIDADSRVTVYAGKVEYGQGIRTGFAIEVADELRLPLSAVEVILSDTDLVPWDMGTFGSQSTARVGVQLRKAAATAREALLELGASRLDLPVSDLTISDGAVAPKRDPSRRVTYGDLVAGQEQTRDILDDAPLTPADEFTVMGRPQTRVDAVERVTGRAKYSQDILVDGVLHAKIVRPPSYRAKLLEFDGSVAERLPGVAAVVREGDLIAVLAENDEQAEMAARVVSAHWEEQAGQPSRFDMPQLLVESASESMTMQEAGSLDEGFRAADHVLEATYYVPYISNAPMEPKASLAMWEGGHLTIWAGTQRPFGLRQELASHFGLPEDQVRVIAPEVGGGFGSKSYYPVAMEAAVLAKAAGRPVRVAWSRAEETAWSTFRPAALIQIKSGFKSDGTIVAWDYHAYHAGPRPMIGRRGADSPYDIPNARVIVSAGESPLRAGLLSLARRRRQPLRARSPPGRNRRRGRRRPRRAAPASPVTPPFPPRAGDGDGPLRLAAGETAFRQGRRPGHRPRRRQLRRLVPRGRRPGLRGQGVACRLGAGLRPGCEPRRREEPDGGRHRHGPGRRALRGHRLRERAPVELGIRPLPGAAHQQRPGDRSPPRRRRHHAVDRRRRARDRADGRGAGRRGLRQDWQAHPRAADPAPPYLAESRGTMTTAPRKTYPELLAMAQQFLKDHRLGILATGKRNGTPQQSILSYAFDGKDVVISTGDQTAKAKNIRKRPGVSLAVSDGPTCVVVYGSARLLGGAAAEAYLGRPPGSGRQPGTPTLIVFSPETYRWARLEG